MFDHFFPLLFPKDSESLKILDIRLREVGAKRPLNGTSKVNRQTDGQTHTQTDISTYRKHRPRGPMLWKFTCVTCTLSVWQCLETKVWIPPPPFIYLYEEGHKVQKKTLWKPFFTSPSPCGSAKGPPLLKLKWKIIGQCCLIAQMKRLDALIATHKNRTHFDEPFLRKWDLTDKKVQIKLTLFVFFSDFFLLQNCTCLRVFKGLYEVAGST